MGIGITITGLYFYENYKLPISNLSGELQTNLNQISNNTATPTTQTNNVPSQQTEPNQQTQTLAQQEEQASNSAQLKARQQAALLGQQELQRQQAEQAQQQAAIQAYNKKLGVTSPPAPSTQSSSTQATTNQQASVLDQLRQVMLDELNNYRSQAVLSPVKMDNEQPTQQWAEQLLSERCIHHISDNGDTPQGRYFDSNLSGFLIDENVAGGTVDPSSLAQFITDEDNQMMNNDADSNWGHRDNILNPANEYVSIGIAYDESNMVFVQDFEVPLQGNEYIPASEYHATPDQKSCW